MLTNPVESGQHDRLTGRPVADSTTHGPWIRASRLDTRPPGSRVVPLTGNTANGVAEEGPIDPRRSVREKAWEFASTSHRCSGKQDLPGPRPGLAGVRHEG
jgi:hypothetical protein